MNKTQWANAIVHDLETHGENSVYGIAANLNADHKTVYKYLQALIDSGRIRAMTYNEFQGDGSNRMLYLLPEQYNQVQVRRKEQQALALVKECNMDPVLLDCLVERLVELPGFEDAVKFHRRG